MRRLRVRGWSDRGGCGRQGQRRRVVVVVVAAVAVGDPGARGRGR